jgi:DNA-binding CsgD family transcriptional regulator
MTVATTDEQWVITSISSDVHRLLGRTVDEMMGQVFLSMMGAGDEARLVDADAHADGDMSYAVRFRMRHARGDWVDVCGVLSCLAAGAGRWLVLLADPRRTTGDRADRLSQLERHLWNIAAEVEASGVLQLIDSGPDPARFPQLRGLSARQWEVLQRLVNGERVPTIAEELFVSQSAVRNHLSAIFERFGIHSQAELMALLRRSDALPSKNGRTVRTKELR